MLHMIWDVENFLAFLASEVLIGCGKNHNCDESYEFETKQFPEELEQTSFFCIFIISLSPSLVKLLSQGAPSNSPKEFRPCNFPRSFNSNEGGLYTVSWHSNVRKW